MSTPISKTDALNSHSDIFKKIAILNSWQKYLQNICEAHFSSCIFLLYGSKILRFPKFLQHLQKFGTAKYFNLWHSPKLKKILFQVSYIKTIKTKNQLTSPHVFFVCFWPRLIWLLKPILGGLYGFPKVWKNTTNYK